MREERQSGLPRQLANLLLTQTGFEQRRRHLVLPCRFLPGAKVTLVVRIHAVGDALEAALPAEFLHQGEQLILAMEAADGVVAHVLRTLQFLGGHHFQRDLPLLREGNRILQLETGQAGRIGNYRQHVVAKNLMGGIGQESGIHSARIGHQRTAQRAQVGLQALALGRQIWQFRELRQAYHPHMLVRAGHNGEAVLLRGLLVLSQVVFCCLQFRAVGAGLTALHQGGVVFARFCGIAGKLGGAGRPVERIEATW